MIVGGVINGGWTVVVVRLLFLLDGRRVGFDGDGGSCGVGLVC
jgi:hypothetical protein